MREPHGGKLRVHSRMRRVRDARLVEVVPAARTKAVGVVDQHELDGVIAGAPRERRIGTFGAGGRGGGLEQAACAELRLAADYLAEQGLRTVGEHHVERDAALARA